MSTLLAAPGPVPASAVIRPFDRSAVEPATSFGCYILYGHVVLSEITLPIAPTAPSLMPPALTFRRAGGAPPQRGELAAVRRGPDGTEWSTRRRDESGEWIRHLNIGTFHITPDFQSVDVYPDPGVDDEMLGLVLVGQISTFILGKLGFPCLHASAVMAGERTAVFVGTNGQGKSTMAASFLARGATLLTDDALPLRLEGDHVFGGPGLPLMKMWDDTVGALAIAERLPNLPQVSKKLLVLDGRFPFAQAPGRLDRIFCLSRYQASPGVEPEVQLAPLTPCESVAVLFAHTSWNMLLTREEVARLLPFYARLSQRLPLWSLRYPHGYEHQDLVHQRLMQELSSQ